VAGAGIPLAEFERYADGAIVHCVSEYQARKVLAALQERMAGVGLELHPGNWSGASEPCC
jgi:RNA-directed DNA polymerase